MRNLAIGNNQLWDVQYVDPLVEEEVATKGRNSKIPHKANHGARPCSSVMRKLKRKGFMKRPNTRE